MELRPYIPTWSPGPTPPAARQCATRLLICSRSAYVIVLSPQAIARRSGTASTACSNRSAMFSAMGKKVERVIVLGNPFGALGGLVVMSTVETSAGAEQPHALVEQRGQVLIVTLNRPEARNALSGPMMAIMKDAWDRVDADPDIRACILTGA